MTFGDHVMSGQGKSTSIQCNGSSSAGCATILVVKPNRFETETIGASAKSVYPDAQVYLCQDGAEAMAFVHRTHVSLGLIGVNLPDMDGGDLSERFVEGGRVSRIMLLAEQITEVTCNILQREVVDGFFDCSVESTQSLAEAIRRVGEGGGYSSYSLREARRLACAGRIPLDRLLSRAEMLVFTAIGDGSDDLAASALLGLSIHTVHTHRQRIKRKLDLRTLADLVREATIRGVVRFGPEGVIRPGLGLPLTRGPE